MRPLRRYDHDGAPWDLQLYLDKYLRAPPPSPTARRIVVDESLTPAHVAAAIDATDGFSGREISKLAIAWQAASYGSADARFTPEIMASVLEVRGDSRRHCCSYHEIPECMVAV